MRFLIGLVLGALASSAIATLIAGLIMAPSTSDQIRMAIVFSIVAATTVIGVLALKRWAGSSLVRRAIVTAGGAPLIMVVAITVGSITMFVNEHDLTFILVLVGLASMLALVVTYALTAPLAGQLVAVQEVSHSIAASGSGHGRHQGDDEIDHLIDAFDAMTARLDQATQARRAAEAERALLITSLTHDVRTPLTAARAAIEALQDGMSPDPDRYLASVHNDLDAVATLVDDLFLLGKLESGQLFSEIQTGYLGLEREPIDLTELVDDAAQSLAPVAACRNVRIEHDHRRPIHTTGATTEVARVIRNLLDNAIRHSPSGGHVTISIDETPEPTILITDQGDGFTSDFIPRAFEPFERAEPARDRTRGGAGLGLAVARAIVTAHNGDIWIEPGPGGRVGLSLPILEDLQSTNPQMQMP